MHVCKNNSNSFQKFRRNSPSYQKKTLRNFRFKYEKKDDIFAMPKSRKIQQLKKKDVL